MKKHIFLGIEIERKVDILAFSAFLITICTLSIKLYDYFNGAKIILEKPNQVIIKKIEIPPKTIAHNKLPPEKDGYVNFVIDMIYYNGGAPGYSDSIKNESALFKIGSNEFYYKWQYFAIIDEKDGKLEEGKKEIAGPKTVKAKEVELHETHFFPSNQFKKDGSLNFLFWGTFIELLENTTNKYILIELEYSTYAGNTGSKTCTVKLDKSLLKHLQEKKWTSAECI